ncbi:MAG: hypothetical protein IPF96_14730 [Rhodobacter sp.]|nr:hypothetical protein [Rhodobacter sp.]
MQVSAVCGQAVAQTVSTGRNSGRALQGGNTGSSRVGIKGIVAQRDRRQKQRHGFGHAALAVLGRHARRGQDGGDAGNRFVGQRGGVGAIHVGITRQGHPCCRVIGLQPQDDQRIRLLRRDGVRDFLQTVAHQGRRQPGRHWRIEQPVRQRAQPAGLVQPGRQHGVSPRGFPRQIEGPRAVQQIRRVACGILPPKGGQRVQSHGREIDPLAVDLEQGRRACLGRVKPGPTQREGHGQDRRVISRLGRRMQVGQGGEVMTKQEPFERLSKGRVVQPGQRLGMAG